MTETSEVMPRSNANFCDSRENWALARQASMEAAGIEPASENVPRKSLHTCQVLIFVVSRPKRTCNLAETPAHRVSPFAGGPRARAILQKMTPFSRPTGEPTKDVASC